MKQLTATLLVMSMLVFAGCESRQRMDGFGQRIVLLEERLAAAEKTIEKLSNQTGMPSKQTNEVTAPLNTRTILCTAEDGGHFARLSANNDDASLSFFDGAFMNVLLTKGGLMFLANNKPRASFMARDDQSYLELGNDGAFGADLRASKGMAVLTMSDEKIKGRVMLVTREDASMLRLIDRQGTDRASLEVIEDLTQVVLSDKTGKTRALLAVGEDGPSLKLSDEKGNVRVVVGVVSTVTPAGKKIKCPESTVTLFSPDGTVLWQVP